MSYSPVINREWEQQPILAPFQLSDFPTTPIWSPDESSLAQPISFDSSDFMAQLADSKEQTAFKFETPQSNSTNSENDSLDETRRWSTNESTISSETSSMTTNNNENRGSVKNRRRKAWKDESQSRRQCHAASDARRRAAISKLQNKLVKIIRERTGNNSAQLTTQQALEEAIEILEQKPQPILTETSCSSLPSMNYSTSFAYPYHYFRQLSSMMDLAIAHYSSGLAFHPTFENYKSSSSLDRLIRDGGRCTILSADMRFLDTSYCEPGADMSEIFGKHPNSKCSLRLSLADSEPPISYTDLANLLDPVIRSMDNYDHESTGVASVAPIQHAPRLLVIARFIKDDQYWTCLKLMTLIRHADRRRMPVLMAIQLAETVMPC